MTQAADVLEHPQVLDRLADADGRVGDLVDERARALLRARRALAGGLERALDGAADGLDGFRRVGALLSFFLFLAMAQL